MPSPTVAFGAGTLAGVEFHVAPIGGTRLVDDVQKGNPAVTPFYAGSPYESAVYRKKAAAVAQRMDAAARRRVQDALRPTTPRAAEKLARVMAGEGFVVTTGQQAGLFGGPLYTLTKMLSAIRLAERLEAELGKPVLPVFWVAADDHDWDEVNHADVLDRAQRVQRITLAGPAEPPLPMSLRPLGADVTGALATLAECTEESAFRRDALGVVSSAYQPGRTVAAAFEELMFSLLRPFDCAVVSSAHRAMKEAAAPLIANELKRQAEHATALQTNASRLEAAGYHNQVEIDPAASNVFYQDNEGRERLVREDGGWLLRRTRRRISHDELLATLASEPMRFSPGVLLRPVVESALLPTLAYVAGPAELSYFAQIGPLFDAHGIERTPAFPRLTITIVEAKVRKILAKFDLDVAAVRRPLHELIRAVVRDALPQPAADALQALRTSLTEQYAALDSAASAIDPTLSGRVRGTERRALQQVDDLERRIVSRLATHADIGVAQLERAAASLYPHGAPQERVLNIVPFLGRYGMELIPAMRDALPARLLG